ncbi:rho GTPase-activating protein 10-like [Dendroctonus ponderosae]|uniref:rho GTPase-activating protein 10-like n=1 Tax=Dendroctonus ponderosae TaxID=77166 RepID=UPI0020363641|nr:rho GTPase-activating protein 10-like [Dendroctonus ponderosae]
MGLDRRKADKVALDDPQEWETKTITTALKTYLRNLPEPLMSFKHHNDFINAVKRESRQNMVHEVHKLLYKLPKTNLEVLSILIKHLTKKEPIAIYALASSLCSTSLFPQNIHFCAFSSSM